MDGNQGTDFISSSVITGIGALVQNGTGNLTLTINGGTLTVGGIIADSGTPPLGRRVKLRSARSAKGEKMP